jgi:hypothetical protein
MSLENKERRLHIPPPDSNFNTLLALSKASHPLEWNLYSYVLNEDLVKSTLPRDDGFKNIETEETTFGALILLGSFSTREGADTRAIELMKLTNYKRFMISKVGVWKSLTLLPENPTNIYINRNGNVKKFHKQVYSKETEDYYAKEKIRQELLEEQANEQDSENFEYYKAKTYLAISTINKINKLQSQLEDLMLMKNKYENKMKKVISDNPEHHTNFGSIMIDRLTEIEYKNLMLGYENLTSKFVLDLEDTKSN